MWKRHRSTDKRYSGDNRLISSKSSHRRGGLAPRCRLITSWGWRRSQGSGCSPVKVVRELGSERKLHCVLPQRCGTINLTYIGGTLTGYRTSRGQYRGKIRSVSNEELAYIAGFLDGDGCVMAQLVHRKDYIYGYQVRTSIVFYQKSRNQRILHWLKSQLKFGYIRHRKDGMTEYTIVGLREVKSILTTLLPYLRLKKELAEEIITLIRSHPKRMTPEALVPLSKMVDKTARFNYSKKRTNTSETVRQYLKKAGLIPVETEAEAKIA